MPGQYGNEQVTIQNLKVVKVDEARNCILIKGAIPGSEDGLVMIGSAKKAKK
jgi:large subunit ribosomal protein L3